MRFRRCSISLCAAASVLLIGPSAGQAQKFDYGVHAERLGSQTLTEDEVTRMREGGVDIVRVTLEWEAVQSSGPDQPYDWTNFDKIVEWSVQGSELPDVEILPVLIGTPYWVEGTVTNNNPPIKTQADLELWGDFVTAAVDRYGANGPIRAWQVWNEPNLKNFWDGSSSPTEYADFLDFTDKAIRRGDPTADTILAAMPQRPNAPKPQVEFLEPLYDIKGIERDFDAVATHTFADKRNQILDSVEAVRNVMNDAGDKRTPLWVTEIGYASAGPSHPFRRSEAGQATILGQLYGDLSGKVGRKLGVEMAVWFAWRDADTDPPVAASNDRWQTYTGLFTNGGVPKPAWMRFTEVAGGDPGEGVVAVP